MTYHEKAKVELEAALDYLRRNSYIVASKATKRARNALGHLCPDRKT
jgi:hypothetical protein